jgi:hypothetical protein
MAKGAGDSLSGVLLGESRSPCKRGFGKKRWPEVCRLARLGTVT